jgi:hypothetical protein
MSPSTTTLDELDLEISVAYIALGSARGLCTRSPNAENERRVGAAETELDRLLDQRLAVRDAAAV